MVPERRYAKACDEEFVVHERYRMEAIAERSMRSHNHFFAELHDCWLNLPEGVGNEFLNEEHWRKHLLIKAGYYNLRTYVASSRAEAERVARWSRPDNDYAIIRIDGCVVEEYTAKSQAKAAMKAKDFQDAKSRVLDLAYDMIGVQRRSAA